MKTIIFTSGLWCGGLMGAFYAHATGGIYFLFGATGFLLASFALFIETND